MYNWLKTKAQPPNNSDKCLGVLAPKYAKIIIDELNECLRWDKLYIHFDTAKIYRIKYDGFGRTQLFYAIMQGYLFPKLCSSPYVKYIAIL